MKKGCIIAGAVLLLVAPLIVVSATMYTLMLPNIYASRVLVSVSEDVAMDPFVATDSQASAYNPFFLRTQIEIIQSKPLLDQVVNRLNLQEEWGMNGERLPREVALRILKNSVQVIQLRDTSLLAIHCKRPHPDEAAMIANELAESYRDYRLDALSREIRSGIEAMEEALREQAQRVLEAEKRIQEIREMYELKVDAAEPEKETPAEFRRALADLENERFIYKQLNARIREEMVRGNPRNPVEIIDAAEPNRRPVSPNLFLNVLAACLLGGFAALTGAVLLGFGLTARRSPNAVSPAR